MDIAFLLAYLALPILALWLCRNLAWLAVYTAASVSIIGLLVGVVIDTGRTWNWVSLQWTLLLALALVPVAAFFHRGRVRAPLGRQALAILAPMGLILGFIGLVTYVLAETPAIYQPVAYLIGHSTAATGHSTAIRAQHGATCAHHGATGGKRFERRALAASGASGATRGGGVRPRRVA